MSKADPIANMDHLDPYGSQRRRRNSNDTAKENDMTAHGRRMEGGSYGTREKKGWMHNF